MLRRFRLRHSMRSTIFSYSLKIYVIILLEEKLIRELMKQ